MRCPNCDFEFDASDFDRCPNCGILLDVKPGLPWDHRQEIGFFQAMFETLKLVLFKPTDAFTAMRSEGGLIEPLIYAVVLGSVGAIVGLIWQGLFQSLGVLASEYPQESIFNLFFVVIAAVFMPVFITAGIFISSGILHLCLMIVGAANRPFETTFRIVCFAGGSTALIQLIPLCGGLVGGIWTIVLEVIGVEHAHGTTTGKAVLAVLLPVLFCCGCGLIGLIIGGAGMFTALGTLFQSGNF
ncbi:YIP1 family protein [bacterium]|nr:YIP1 family protein [bacterium]